VLKPLPGRRQIEPIPSVASVQAVERRPAAPAQPALQGELEAQAAASPVPVKEPVAGPSQHLAQLHRRRLALQTAPRFCEPVAGGEEVVRLREGEGGSGHRVKEVEPAAAVDQKQPPPRSVQRPYDAKRVEGTTDR